MLSFEEFLVVAFILSLVGLIWLCRNPLQRAITWDCLTHPPFLSKRERFAVYREHLSGKITVTRFYRDGSTKTETIVEE